MKYNLYGIEDKVDLYTTPRIGNDTVGRIQSLLSHQSGFCDALLLVTHMIWAISKISKLGIF